MSNTISLDYIEYNYIEALKMFLDFCHEEFQFSVFDEHSPQDVLEGDELKNFTQDVIDLVYEEIKDGEDEETLWIKNVTHFTDTLINFHEKLYIYETSGEVTDAQKLLFDEKCLMLIGVLLTGL